MIALAIIEDIYWILLGAIAAKSKNKRTKKYKTYTVYNIIETEMLQFLGWETKEKIVDKIRGMVIALLFNS